MFAETDRRVPLPTSDHFDEADYICGYGEFRFAKPKGRK
jgi:hypothetical protein